jgi:hypothetical protein
MSGYPDFNFPTFNAVAAALRQEGWIVFNPAEKDSEVVEGTESYATGDHIKVQEEGFDFKEAYLWDVEKVIEADAIFMLPGWEASPGARGEHAVAVAVQKHYPSYQILYA